MITDPMFYLLAVPAVALSGLSKGGFGGAFGFASVPMMALVISPVQAAGLMLPILLVMDVIAVWGFRKDFDRQIVMTLLPWGLLGTALGWMTASVVSDDVVRLVVGGIAIAFLVRVAWSSRPRAAPLGAAVPELEPGTRRMPDRAALWGTLTGYTSFIAHAGGPPYQTYVVPIRLDPVLYTGTSAIFFAVINVAKVVPYAALGQFDTENLATAGVLLPIAVISTWIGVRIVRVVDEALFYRVLFVSIALIGTKLIYDGASHLLVG
jgi:uncharacterized membrane protein YfcA